ncbi:hypothetical protein FXV83_23570 [Bradyrhizobium hipponense]|uniref:Lectin-like protein BA14k n=1 Tax=Bradyrhizobium hipponense TaxID=2605638 RepID=A0A5S4YJV2_9BRAD|nr:hypothetical protein [Bradyrhizobium hipponense]TYO64333.1 hypothetical protein FXV83_23570 [Bradyrhizobium hipponense]
MKTARLALFAALIGFGSLLGSADYSPAAAGWGSQYAWMGNKPYMACLKYVGAFGSDYPNRNRNIETCKQNYLPGGR